MLDIRTHCGIWASQTYGQALRNLGLQNEAEYLTYLRELKILNIPMDGFSCEKLPKTEENGKGLNVTFSAIFHQEIEHISFTPLAYLRRLIDECRTLHFENPKIIGILARGLRTLTSLLREPVFANDLADALRQYDPGVGTNLNTVQDSADHTDVLLSFHGIQYRIWLYQFSPRGLPHDIERLTGRRGNLPNGIHLICPLHTEKATEYLMKTRKKERLQAKASSLQASIVECSPRANKKIESLRTKFQNVQNEIIINDMALTEAHNISSRELDVLNGWFFYSLSHVNRIAQLLIQNPPRQNYADVVNLLTIPERFVGEIQIFEKE